MILKAVSTQGLHILKSRTCANRPDRRKPRRWVDAIPGRPDQVVACAPTPVQILLS